VSIGAGEEARRDVDTAETVERGVHSPWGVGSPPRAQNRPGTREPVRSASDAACALETSPPKGDAGAFLGTTRQTRARPRSLRSAVIPTNRATQSGVGLGEKKSGSYPLRVGESCVSLRIP